MVPHRSFFSARIVFSLLLILIVCSGFGLALQGVFSAGSFAATPSPSSAVAARPLLRAAVAQTTTPLLNLRFEGVLTGEQGETPTQSAAVSFQTGVSGQGLYMDRGNRLTYPSDGNVDSTEGTIELWLKPSWNGNDGLNHAIFRYGTNAGFMVLGKEGSNLRLALNRASENGSLELDVFTSIVNWQAEQWHHVAASWSNAGQFLRLYVDGTLVSERSFVGTLPTISNTVATTLQIGGDSVRFPLLATIDDVFISHAPRTAQEIATRMMTGITVTSATITPNITAIEMYPGWTYWQDFKYSAVSAALGPLTLPWQVGTLASTSSSIATIDALTGRIKAVAPGTATITATFNGVPTSITVNILTVQKAVAEETLDSYLTTPATGHLYKVPVAIIRYFPTRDGTNVDTTAAGYTSTLEALHTKQLRVEKKLKFMLEEGSRYRGYAGTVAPSLGYQVVKVINVYEEIPPGLPTTTPGVYFPDYKQILQRFNAQDLVNNQGVKEIWLEQYVNGRIALDESNMFSMLTGDISRSLRTNDDLPAYAKGYTVFGINFAQGENMAARQRGHHLETLLTQATLLQDGNDALFQEFFIGRDTSGNFQQGRCGMTDIPPNGLGNFDFNNLTEVSSDIEDWYPDGRGAQKPINRDAWGNRTYSWPETPEGSTEGQWYIYWMQAIPGLNNVITRFDTDRLTNWWQFAADWDAAVQTRLGVSEPLACAYALSSTSRSVPGNGASSNVNITCGANCKWVATSNESWIKILTPGGTGNGTVNFTVDPATAPRTGTMVIGGIVFTITQSSCTFNLTPLTQTVAAAGTSGSITVALVSGTNCAWTAVSNANWITINSGSSGNGNGTVNFTVAANTGAARTGTLTIADQTVTINQNSGCTYTLNPTSRNVASTGGADSTNVQTGAGCPWTAVSNDSWITISSGSTGTGPGTVSLNVQANTGVARNGTVTIGGQTYTISQAAANPSPTLTSLNPTSATVGSAAFTLTVNGTNFNNASVVNWNGAARTTTFVNTTQLQAAIPATDLTTGGSVNITVTNPAPGGGTSGTLPFAVNNPVPTLSNLIPAAAAAGSAGFTLTLSGASFVANSTVQVNGVNRTTTFVNGSQLAINVTAAEIASAGVLNMVVVNPAPGGGTSSSQPLTINNPVPTLTSLNQAFATAGSAGFTLTVNGTGFVNGSQVRWKGVERTTTYINGTQLTASIPATDLAVSGTADVTVANPTPGGGSSNALPFTINNPVPTLTSLAPNTATAGGSAFPLTVNGSGFVTNSIVRWNGSDRVTTFVNTTQLTANITAADIGSASGVNITVFNPTPGGGTTTALTFTITTGCAYVLASNNQNFTATGGNSSFNLNTGTGCAWTAVSNDAWINITSGSSSSGNGTVNFTVAANTGAARSGTITAGGQTFTVTQEAAQQSLCVAQRSLPSGYVPTQTFTVSIQVTPATGTQSYAVEDTPPPGWAISAIDNNGQFDSVNGKVKWGPFFDNTARTLTYAVTPPAGTTGSKTFAGSVSVNGTGTPLCGTANLDPNDVFHPADLNNNLRIEINELTAYGAAWKAGTPWSRPPITIDINYLTNAGLIWKVGEVYHYDITKSPPFAPGVSFTGLQPVQQESGNESRLAGYVVVPASSVSGYAPELGLLAALTDAVEAAVFAAPETTDNPSESVLIYPQGEDTANEIAAAPAVLETFAGTALSSFSAANYTPGTPLTVTIAVTPDAGTNVYAIEETPPLGWVVSNITQNGTFDNTNKKVKWGPFFDNSARTFSYVVTPPAGETGTRAFAGSASFDGGSVVVSGARSLTAATSCNYALTTSSQNFAASGGTGGFNLTAASGCTWNATTNDGWIAFTQSSGSGNGAVNYSVAANAGTARTGIITVAGQTFTVNQSGNATPTITPASALTRQQEATANAVIIATVGDAETTLSSLNIATTSVPTGLSITGLTNNNGTVSAVVTASCQAALGTNTIGLKVTDAQGAFASANLTVNVTSNPSCFLQINETSASDQRAGSVLLYSYYTSSLSAPAAQNTQIRLTNTHESQAIAVRLYFVDGQFASVQSLFICLPANQTANFLMSETDPGITGYLLAVAVDKTTGCPVNFNYLTGGAAIKLSAGHTANLGAIAIAALAANPATCSGNATNLNFDGTNYGRLPRMLVLDTLPSLRDGNDTRLMLARIGGSLLTNAGPLGTISGKIYNSNRAAQDFTFNVSTPQSSSGFSLTFPRLATRLDTFIPAGQSGWMKLWTDANIGLIGSVINFSSNLRTTTGFVGGYNLQQGALSPAVSLEIPISAPTCQ